MKTYRIIPDPDHGGYNLVVKDGEGFSDWVAWYPTKAEAEEVRQQLQRHARRHVQCYE